jgi:hypothetical protein
MPNVGFEPTMFEPEKTVLALDRTATVIGTYLSWRPLKPAQKLNFSLVEVTADLHYADLTLPCTQVAVFECLSQPCSQYSCCGCAEIHHE